MNKRKKNIYKPSTNQILISLPSMPDYSKLLLANNSDRPYGKFLRWLIDKYFYNRT